MLQRRSEEGEVDWIGLKGPQEKNEPRQRDCLIPKPYPQVQAKDTRNAKDTQYEGQGNS